MDWVAVTNLSSDALARYRQRQLWILGSMGACRPASCDVLTHVVTPQRAVIGAGEVCVLPPRVAPQLQVCVRLASLCSPAQAAGMHAHAEACAGTTATSPLPTSGPQGIM